MCTMLKYIPADKSINQSIKNIFWTIRRTRTKKKTYNNITRKNKNKNDEYCSDGAATKRKPHTGWGTGFIVQMVKQDVIVREKKKKGRNYSFSYLIMIMIMSTL